MAIPLEPDEQLLHDAMANLFRGFESVGGRIRVTNRRVLFDPHVINVRYEAVAIPIASVAEVRPRNSLFIVPNGMLVRTDDGHEHKFVVWGRGKLIELIGSLASQARMAG